MSPCWVETWSQDSTWQPRGLGEGMSGTKSLAYVAKAGGDQGVGGNEATKIGMGTILQALVGSLDLFR